MLAACASDVGFVLRSQRASLATVLQQVGDHMTPAQLRRLLADAIAELDHDLHLMRGSADVVAVLAGELGMTFAVVPVTEASAP